MGFFWWFQGFRDSKDEVIGFSGGFGAFFFQVLVPQHSQLGLGLGVGGSQASGKKTRNPKPYIITVDDMNSALPIKRNTPEFP